MVVSFSECSVFLNIRIFQLIFKHGAVKAPLALAAEKSLVYSAFLVRVCLDKHVTVGFKEQAAAY